MFGGRVFLGFVLIAIGRMAILHTFLHLQDNIKVIRRYEGWYYTRLVSYYIIFRFETDWSRIRPLPTTTLTKLVLSYGQLYVTLSRTTVLTDGESQKLIKFKKISVL